MQNPKHAEEHTEIDDNIERPIESLDPKPPPTITDWYRKKDKKKRQVDFL